jgi:hypothetical protein
MRRITLVEECEELRRLGRLLGKQIKDAMIEDMRKIVRMIERVKGGKNE